MHDSLCKNLVPPPSRILANKHVLYLLSMVKLIAASRRRHLVNLSCDLVFERFPWWAIQRLRGYTVRC